MSLPKPNRRTEIFKEVSAALQPINALECWLVRQVAIAAWEMETVRLNKNVTEAEALLNATYARANRNWLRARRELTRLQASRVARAARLSPDHQKRAAAAPLADAAALPVSRT